MTGRQKADMLIKIANFLDDQGMDQEADLIDSILLNQKEVGDIELEIPQDELEVLKHVLKSLQQSLE